MSRVFLSYCSKDRYFVADLARRLADEGIDVWYDQWEIRVGDSIVDKINQGIASSDYLIIVLSKNSVTSRWVREELAAATVRTIQKDAFLLPVLLEDCDIPELLRHRRYANFEDDSEGAFKELISVITSRRQPPETSEKDATIMELLTKFLQPMIADYDSASEEQRKKIIADVSADYRGFTSKWSMSEGVYEVYINQCIIEKRILSLVEFIDQCPRIIKEYPHAEEEIVAFLVSKL